MRSTVPGLTPNLAAALRTDRPPLRASRIRAANAVVLVNFDDLAAHVAGNLAQLTFLVGRGSPVEPGLKPLHLVPSLA